MNNDTLDVADCSFSTVSYPTFAERLRPRKFEELIIAESTIRKLKQMLDSKDLMNMTFYGAPGSGKTTCANIFDNSDNFDMLRINASLQNSVDTIRNQVEQYASSRTLFDKFKVILLDEADFLSKNAQASLRGLIEITVKNCRFILTCNNLSKIDDALLSRCKPFCFDVPYSSLNSSIDKLTLTVKSRLQEMNREIDDSVIRHIVQMKFPDYRAIANDIDFELR